MYTETSTIVETDTRIGRLEVEEVFVYTSDDDLFNNFFRISINEEVKHPQCNYRDAVRLLGHYMGEM